jgi:ornithine decarboxylase
VPLPEAQEGDWLLFFAMGAYVTGVSTLFNGYGGWDTVAVSTL